MMERKKVMSFENRKKKPSRKKIVVYTSVYIYRVYIQCDLLWGTTVIYEGWKMCCTLPSILS
jgi:hypothetical protein